jgi:nucleoside-diphosphate-sugar epimerase
VTIVRPFNTFGPRQSARAVIPTIITQLLAGKTEIKLGSLHPTRDLLFVKDTASAFVAIAKSDKTIGEEINIATEQEISIQDLAQTIIDLINPDAKIISDDVRLRPEKSEVERLLGSADKIKSLTDWKHNIGLNEGLKQTIEWFRNPENLKNYKADIYNV